MTDVDNLRIAAHRRNLMRYRRILATPLTDIEHDYVRRRMAEERAQLDRLEQAAAQQESMLHSVIVATDAARADRP